MEKWESLLQPEVVARRCSIKKTATECLAEFNGNSGDGILFH